MNKETVDLLRELAAKLGTTAEHLWGVLTRQAIVDGVISLLQYAIIGVAVYYFIKLVKRTVQKTTAHDWDEMAWAPVTLLGIGLGILCVVALLSLPMTAAAFFNPEYWALKQIWH